MDLRYMRQRTETKVSVNGGRRKQKYREKGGSKPPKIGRTALFYSTMSIQLQIPFYDHTFGTYQIA